MRHSGRPKICPARLPLMKPSAGEGCLKSLRALGAERGLICTSEVAHWPGVQPRLAVVMIGQLTGGRLIESRAPLAVRLASRGRQQAAHVVRRRRRLRSVLSAEHGYSQAAQVIAAPLAFAVPSRVINGAARRCGEPDPSPGAEPAPAWAVAMRARLAEAGQPLRDNSGPARPTAAPTDCGPTGRHPHPSPAVVASMAAGLAGQGADGRVTLSPASRPPYQAVPTPGCRGPYPRTRRGCRPGAR